LICKSILFGIFVGTRPDQYPQYYMLINYFKIAWRNLFKNKFHTGINIGGLIIGFTIGIFVLMTVYSQLSADKFHSNRKRLYQAYQVFNKKEGEQINNQFDYAHAPVFKAEVPAIEKATRFLSGGTKIIYGGKQLTIPVYLVDADFLSMFSFPVVRSGKLNPLSGLTDLVLTEESAKKIFGDEDPLGKTVQVETGAELQGLTVTAVLKDIPGNSSIKFSILARFENISDYARNKNNWENSSHPVYVQLKEGATQSQAESQLKQVNKRYVPGWYTELEANGARPDKRGDVFATRLLPLDKVHFSTRVNGHRAVNPSQIYAILTVGLLIILIASFNFININLANAFTRTKEIGVRKCLGAAKTKLFAQFWSESFIVCFISFILSLTLVNILIGAFSKRLSLNSSFTSVVWKPDFLLMGLVLLLLVSLIAGGYPSWVMIKFKVIETLKGNITIKRKSIVRNSLIVVQFVIACIMISCTFIIYRQFQHLQNADLGMKTETLISVPLANPEKGRETLEKLRTRLASDPHIVSITGSSINLGKGMDRRSAKSTIDFQYQGQDIYTNVVSVDYDYMKTLGLKMLEGRDFDRSFASDSAQNILLSESAAKQFNEENIAGKYIKIDSSSAPLYIAGVFPDIHLYSMRERVQPLMLNMNKWEKINYCFIKTTSQSLVAGMNTIKKEMAVLEPGIEFRGSYVDENINRWYEEEQAMSIIFSVSAGVSILLSCMGLLAMVLLIIQQRVKEIGVRKVLGASVRNISLLISKDFLFLVLISVIIATPVSWLTMNAWLQDYPYRIQIEWWMFALVALAALLIALLTIGANTVKAAMQNPVKSLRSE
jgi:putative ABC transport system permease protein